MSIVSYEAVEEEVRSGYNQVKPTVPADVLKLSKSSGFCDTARSQAGVRSSLNTWRIQRHAYAAFKLNNTPTSDVVLKWVDDNTAKFDAEEQYFNAMVRLLKRHLFRLRYVGFLKSFQYKAYCMMALHEDWQACNNRAPNIMVPPFYPIMLKSCIANETSFKPHECFFTTYWEPSTLRPDFLVNKFIFTMRSFGACFEDQDFDIFNMRSFIRNFDTEAPTEEYANLPWDLLKEPEALKLAKTIFNFFKNNASDWGLIPFHSSKDSNFTPPSGFGSDPRCWDPVFRKSGSPFQVINQVSIMQGLFGLPVQFKGIPSVEDLPPEYFDDSSKLDLMEDLEKVFFVEKVNIFSSSARVSNIVVPVKTDLAIPPPPPKGRSLLAKASSRDALELASPTPSKKRQVVVNDAELDEECVTLGSDLDESVEEKVKTAKVFKTHAQKTEAIGKLTKAMISRIKDNLSAGKGFPADLEEKRDSWKRYERNQKKKAEAAKQANA